MITREEQHRRIVEWNKKWRQPCVRCGHIHTETEYVIFHHLNKKNISFALNYVEAQKRQDWEIRQEIEKCIPLCVPCYSVFCKDKAKFNAEQITVTKREYMRKYMREYYAKNREGQIKRQSIYNKNNSEKRIEWRKKIEK